MGRWMGVVMVDGVGRKIAIHRKPQTRRIDEDSTHLHGERCNAV